MIGNRSKNFDETHDRHLVVPLDDFHTGGRQAITANGSELEIGTKLGERLCYTGRMQVTRCLSCYKQYLTH